MGDKTKHVFSFFGKPYAIYSTNNFSKLFNSFTEGIGPKSASSVIWMIRPGSEIVEVLESGDERMLGVINTECLLYANKSTYGMECHNSYQYEEIAAKKFGAVLDFLKSDAYLFTLV